MRMSMLSDLSSAQALRYGSKAQGLARLAEAGAPVPSTICLELEPFELKELGESSLPSELERWVEEQESSDFVIRSSALLEDSLVESRAGLLMSKRISLTPRALSEGILEVAQSIPQETRTLLVQPFMEGELSGVLFSAEPTQGKRGDLILSFARGGCAGIVSGAIEVTTLNLATAITEEKIGPLLWSNLKLFRTIATELETRWEAPVDIEFTIPSNSTAVFLQARPIASLAKWRGREGVMSIEQGPLPPAVAAHSKVTLRHRCAEAGVPISRAWVATETFWNPLPEVEDLPEGSFATVLIHPEQLEGRTQRIFSDTPLDSLRSLLGKAENYWVRHAILKEILVSDITGIATTESDGVLVEFALGHFVPKGLVETAIYKLKNDTWEMVRAPLQSWAYEIDHQTGNALRKPANTKAKPDQAALASLSTLLARLGLGAGEFLEFGISPSNEAFVIDIQSASVPIPSSSTSGVISIGSAEGCIWMVRDFSKASTDNHFIDAQIDPKRANEDVTPIIAVSWLPALELAGEMRHLENSGHRVVGVVFGVYSPLCHLSILLREWGVPAIVNPDIFTMDNIEGAWAGITATESNGSLYIKRLS